MNTTTRRPSPQSLRNAQLLQFVRQRQQCSYAELFANFSDGDPASRATRIRFFAKLGYLVDTQQLCRRGRGQAATYWLDPLAGRPQPTPRHPLAPADSLLPQHVNPWQIPITATPPAYDAMHAPVYQPPAMAAMLPGALDYRRIASHGHRC